MSEKMQVVITAAPPQPDTFLEAGFQTPKNAVTIAGQTILNRIVSVYDEKSLEVRVAMHESEIFNGDVPVKFNNVTNRPRAVPIAKQTAGALCTALLAINYELMDCPLVIAPGDSAAVTESMRAISIFHSMGTDVGTIVYPSSEVNRSYVRIGKDRSILEIAERRVISSYATTGLFYFRNVHLFLQGAAWALTNSINVNGQYFVSHSIHKLLAEGKLANVYTLDKISDYLSLRNPAEVIQSLENNA